MEKRQNNCDCTGHVGCDVCNCAYNDTKCQRCTADHIKVQNKTAMKKGETFCDTFVPKTTY